MTSILTRFDSPATSEDDANTIAMSIMHLTHETSLVAPKIYQQDARMVNGALCSLIRMFNVAMRVQKGMFEFEVLLLAKSISEKYTHDSVEDVALAFKEAFTSGWRPCEFNTLRSGEVMELIDAYFERKALRLEQAHKDLRDSNKSLVGGEIGALAEGLVSSSIESFTEKYQRERRERVARELKEWRIGLEEQEIEPENI